MTKIVKGQSASFALKDFAFVHAGPTSGKSTLIANSDPKVRFVDPDNFLFGPILTREIEARLMELGVSPWAAKGDLRLQWQALENAAVLVVQMLAAKLDLHVVTNLTRYLQYRPFPLISDMKVMNLHGKSMTVFRTPEEMYKIATVRSKRLKQTGFVGLSTFKDWYGAWKRHVDAYDVAVVLEPGMFLSDLFGVEAKVVDPQQVKSLTERRAWNIMTDFLVD